jgi:hypothetical protein
MLRGEAGFDPLRTALDLVASIPVPRAEMRVVIASSERLVCETLSAALKATGFFCRGQGARRGEFR